MPKYIICFKPINILGPLLIELDKRDMDFEKSNVRRGN